MCVPGKNSSLTHSGKERLCVVWAPGRNLSVLLVAGGGGGGRGGGRGGVGVGVGVGGGGGGGSCFSGHQDPERT